MFVGASGRPARAPEPAAGGGVLKGRFAGGPAPGGSQNRFPGGAHPGKTDIMSRGPVPLRLTRSPPGQERRAPDSSPGGIRRGTPDDPGVSAAGRGGRTGGRAMRPGEGTAALGPRGGGGEGDLPEIATQWELVRDPAH